MALTRVMGFGGLAVCTLSLCAIAALAMGLGGQPTNELVTMQGSYDALPASVHTPTMLRPAAAAAPPTAQTLVTPVATAPGLPPVGQATAWGCAAALGYLGAYAAPGFTLECPALADGHEASTSCVSRASRCDTQRTIAIADACPAAYMNEASNSWVLMGESSAPIDPYGPCP